MRIAIFIKQTTLHKNFSGLETQNLSLCTGLVSRGYDVTVFSPKLDLTIDSAEKDGVKYRFIDCSYRYFLSGIDPHSWFNCSLKAFKKEQKIKPFDLAISQSSAGVSVIENKENLNIPVIAIAHGSTMGELQTFLQSHKSIKDIPAILKNIQYALRQFFGRQREYILHSTRVIAVSNAVKRQLLDETFVADNLVSVINNGIKPFQIKKEENLTKPKPFKMLYIGQVSLNKGSDLLLKLMQDPDLSGASMDVMGEGDYLPVFSAAIKEKFFKGDVSLSGKVPYSQIVDYLSSKKADIFVFPTRRFEGFPMVLVEAMFGALPVVSFNLGGVSDAVASNVTGFLVAPGDYKELKKAVITLKNDKSKRDIMSSKSLEKAQNEFSLDIMLDKYEKLFKETLNETLQNSL